VAGSGTYDLVQPSTIMEFHIHEFHSTLWRIGPPDDCSHNVQCSLVARQMNHYCYRFILLTKEGTTSSATAKRDINNYPFAMS
jgi:hypothetical protein